MAQQIASSALLSNASLLISVDNENKEYDRGIVELVAYTLGLGTEEEDLMAIEQSIRALAN